MSIRRSRCRYRRCLAATLLVAASLSGCVSDAGLHTTVQPLKPSVDALAKTAGRGANGANGAWPAPDWVKRYNDPQLDRLAQEALENNPDLQIARARVGSAQAQLDQFASLTGLTGTAAATVSKARLPQPNNVANVSVAGQQIPVQLFDDSTVSPAAVIAGLSYQLDLWGKNAALTRSLLSTRDATRVDAEQARLMLTVALVTLYCELDRAFAMRDILLQKQQAAEHVDAVLRERGARGIDNAYDAADAALKRSRLASQQALNDERLQLTELQIGVLTGRGPERGLSLQRPRLAAATANPPLPAQLPVDLLGRRPDIVAARLRAEAALANTDATRAQFYPDVNLVAFAGLTALTPAALFSRAALTGSIGPAISLPIFDRSRLRAQLGGDYANVDAAVGLYNKTLDEALGDVARQLTSLRTVDTLAAEQSRAVDAATKIVAIAEERHRRGIGMQKDVTLADLSLLDERAQQIDLQGRRRLLQVALVGALGGGFDERQMAGPAVAHSQAAFFSHARVMDTHFE
ncbi:efflux transporter outer membrane subunit [Paraburkholderia sp. D15]|uniref:efflux transporter outer membrane subunit n=1 Tax=Paraburkholderia sp. D15 TaxID=2880218 RepID=UPI00247A608D|nr:efflux transporter outer membrane subunit [Paraburkholderia sp. D15]WGS54814.1 efflux transporter outer membrane subunit [Paraburkholderia sp. D15]